MDNEFWAETRALKANICRNLTAIRAKLNESIEKDLNKLAMDIASYKNRQRFKKMKEEIGGILFAGWIGGFESEEINEGNIGRN